MSEEISRLERSMNWLATIATVSPFIGLLGTVFGIIDAFQAAGAVGLHQHASGGPGHRRGADHHRVRSVRGDSGGRFLQLLFGHAIKEMGARMEDFSLEFLNLERNWS